MKKKTNSLIKRYHDFTEAAYAPFKGHHRAGVCFCNIIFSLFIAAIVILHNFAEIVPRFRVAVLCGLLLFFLVYQGFKLFLVRHRGFGISLKAERSKLSLKIFLVGAAIVFTVFILDLLAHYPGGISSDTINQWTQVVTGEFFNWHPAIHTMIIWLVTRIVPNFSFFLGVQILLFSILSGYMMATLAAWGVKKGWLVAFLITIISTGSTRNIMLYAWKDTTFTVCLLWLSVYIVNIVLSDGKWLHKWKNAGAAAFLCAIISIVRHNGFFFTLPLGILAICIYAKKTRMVIVTTVASFLIVLGITHVVYPLVNVGYPVSQTFRESVGVPMTILSGVMVNEPEALDSQTKEFLNKIADDETWAKTFISGDYNSIKFTTPASTIIDETPPMDLLRMTLRTIKNAPKESLLQLIALTRIVWDPLDWHWDQNTAISVISSAEGFVFTADEIAAMQPIQEKCKEIYDDYISPTINLLTPSHILTSIGLHMLLLLLIGMYSLNSNLGSKALLLFIPSVAYNLGTMLLLCGPDYRFFHFNTVITLPLMIAALAKKQK